MAEAGLDLFELIFDYGSNQRHFLAGEVLKGAVMIVSGQPVRAREIQVELRGEGRNGWVNKTSDKIYESFEGYLSESFSVMNSSQQIPSGRFTIPFQFSLPGDLPSSFEGEYGSIRYTARATFHPTGAMKAVVVEKTFGVAALLDLAAYPITTHPVEAIDSTDFSCCCFPLGSVQASITIPRNGFLTGEEIQISAEVYNGSKKRIEDCQLVLIQHAKFRATSRYESVEDSKEMQYVVGAIGKGNIESGRTMRIQNQSLQVPSVIPTHKGNSLNINYILRVDASPGIEIEIPITIGTKNTQK